MAPSRSQLRPATRAEQDWPRWLRVLIDQTPAGVALLDESGRLNFVNARCAALLGATVEGLLGRTLAEVLPPGTDTKAAHFELRLADPERWLDVMLHDLRADGEEGVAAAVVIHEVTKSRLLDRKVAGNLSGMERLHALSTLLAAPGWDPALLEHILATAIVVAGAARGHFQLVDPATGSLRTVAQRGFSERYLAHFAVGCRGLDVRQVRRIVLEDLRSPPAGLNGIDVDALLVEGVAALVCLPLLKRPGVSLGMLTVHFGEARSPDDDTLRLLELLARMAADFIERTDADRALRLNEERFRALGSTTAYLFFRMAPDWSEMTEIAAPRDGVTPRPNLNWLRDHVHPDDRELVRRKVDQAIASGTMLELEHQCRLPEGVMRWLRMRAVPLRGPDGGVYEWFGSATDITEEKATGEALKVYHDQLEERVTERTAELDAANGALRDEIIERGREHRVHEELLQQLSSAQEAERRRISRELHDEVGQQLAALLLGLNELAEEFRIPLQSDTLRQVQAIAQTIGAEIHNLAVELRPTSLDDLGLARALQAYAGVWAERAKVRIDFHATGFEGRRLPSPLETALYRIVQEALTNVKKHARARTVGIILDWKGQEVSAIVEDDGLGFDPELRRKPNRLGLLGMKERAGLFGGEVRIESSPGSGTTVMVRAPV